ISLSFGTFADVETSVRAQVDRLRSHPWIRPVPIPGLIFDVETGQRADVSSVAYLRERACGPPRSKAELRDAIGPRKRSSPPPSAASEDGSVVVLGASTARGWRRAGALLLARDARSRSRESNGMGRRAFVGEGN